MRNNGRYDASESEAESDVRGLIERLEDEAYDVRDFLLRPEGAHLLVELWEAGANVRYVAPNSLEIKGDVPAELLERVRAAKPQLIALLKDDLKRDQLYWSRFVVAKQEEQIPELLEAVQHGQYWRALYLALHIGRVSGLWDRTPDVWNERAAVKKLEPDAERGRKVQAGGKKGGAIRQTRDGAEIDEVVRRYHAELPHLTWTPCTDVAAKSLGMSGKQVRRRTSVRW